MDFKDSCTYSIAQYCGSDPKLVPFKVEEKNSKMDTQGVFKLQQIHIKVYGHNITIDKEEDVRIMVGTAADWFASVSFIITFSSLF